MSVVVVKQSILEKLTETVYLDYVLKAVGVILFALGMFIGWGEMKFFAKMLLIIGPIAWFVGARFNKVYR
jgi:hypothetical protein